MSLTSRRLAIGGVLFALAAAGDAAARPSVWDITRDRDALKAEHMLEEAERRLEASPAARIELLGVRQAHEDAIASLEAQGADRSADPRVHLALGWLWMPSQSRAGDVGGDYRKAAAEFERVVATAPDGPVAADAWMKLTTAYAKLGLRDRERQAYERVLDLVSEPELRGNVFYNRGDAEVEAGELDAAIVDYRHAIVLVMDPSEQSLIYWSLGLALERSGDLPAALDAVAMAQAIYPGEHYLTALDDENAFFVPPYEKFYMEGLGELACARDAPTPDLVHESYENAQVYFVMYLAGATRDNHRGLANGKLELAMIERKLKKLEAAPVRTPKKLGTNLHIRKGCPQLELPVPPPPPLQLPFTFPTPAPGP